jgi:ribosomal protein L7/L12
VASPHDNTVAGRHHPGMIDHDVAQLRTRVALLERKLAFVMQHLDIAYSDAARSDVSPEVIALVRSGNKVGAIRLHMQQTGVDILAAKELVETIE